MGVTAFTVHAGLTNIEVERPVQCTRAPKFHYCIGERLRDLYSTFGATGCTDSRVRDGGGCGGRTGGVGHGRGAVHSWLGFGAREWLGRAHLSGRYPSLLHNRGSDACSTSSLRQKGF